MDEERIYVESLLLSCVVQSPKKRVFDERYPRKDTLLWNDTFY